MPKELTHWILAEQALAGLDNVSKIREILRAHHELYLAGAVLPDTLLHMFRGPHARLALQLANDFHDSGGNSYAPLIRIEQEFSGDIPEWLFACLLGVLAHMQGDITFHPYVYSLAGIGGMGRHYRLETAIDVYLLRRGADVPARHLRNLVNLQIRENLITAGSLLFDPQGLLPPSAMGKALDLHCRFQNMYDRTFWQLLARLLGRLPGSPIKDKQQLFYPLDRSCDDPMIIGTESWLHPVTGRRSTANIEELADQAVQRIIAAFKGIDQQGTMAAGLADTPGENLLTGMYGVKEQKMQYFSNSGAETDNRPEKTS